MGTTTVGLDGFGNLIVTDADGGDTDDTLTVSRLPGPDRIRIQDPNNTLAAGMGATQVDANTVDVLLASISGSIQVNTLSGNDLLTVDYSNGVFGVPIALDGGTQSSSPGDGLAVKAAGLGVISRPNGGGANAFSGTVQVTGGGTIGYQNIEPLDIDGGGGRSPSFPRPEPTS